MIYCCESYLPNSGNPYLCGDPFEPSDLIRLLDEAGIAAALTIPAPEAPLPGWPPTDNGTVRQAMETYPSRILGCCHVDPRRGREAADMRVPVTIHTNGSADLYPRIADLAERYPGLTVVMEHMGYRPHVALAIDLVKRYANLYLGTTVVGAAEPVVVRQAIREVGAERVLFGANAPWAVPCYGVEGIRSLGLNAEDERLVLGENFRRIYRLS